jgi:outer membrane protein assembly factor BamB
LIYGKTMQDTLVAFAAGREARPALWKMHVGYGYEHAPSMLMEKEGKLFFGTRNGVVYAVVYAIDPAAQKIVWRYKLDNSMVNTVQVLNGKQVIVSTMDEGLSAQATMISASPGQPARESNRPLWRSR